MAEALPPACARPCRECPWRRASAPGWLGPMDAIEWIELVQSDLPIACHLTIVEDGSFHGAHQCAGAAQFRANTHKSPRDPEVAVADDIDTERVFATGMEFIHHHERTA